MPRSPRICGARALPEPFELGLEKVVGHDERLHGLPGVPAAGCDRLIGGRVQVGECGLGLVGRKSQGTPPNSYGAAAVGWNESRGWRPARVGTGLALRLESERSQTGVMGTRPRVPTGKASCVCPW